MLVVRLHNPRGALFSWIQCSENDGLSKHHCAPSWSQLGTREWNRSVVKQPQMSSVHDDINIKNVYCLNSFIKHYSFLWKSKWVIYILWQLYDSFSSFLKGESCHLFHFFTPDLFQTSWSFFLAQYKDFKRYFKDVLKNVGNL